MLRYSPSGLFFCRLLLPAIAAAFVGLASGTSATAQVLLANDAFSSKAAVEADGWKIWFQRTEISPAFDVAEFPSLGGAGSLMIGGNSNSAAHGCWYKIVEGVESGAYYRFTASYTSQAVTDQRWRY